MTKSQDGKVYGIRFGLGAIKAVGFNMMQEAVSEREANGKFADIYDFATRLDPKAINKKSIEALAKAGAFDGLNDNRRQISESFEILSNFANEAKEEANSNQMNLFGSINEKDSRPALKTIPNWTKSQRLKFEFEAFGFFLNEHPIDNRIKDLKHRGIVFSTKIEEDSLPDNSIVKMAGVVASSKHRSGARGRFAYLNISDPFGIYEATIFDEALITANRDLLEDGCEIVIECLIRKDEGGTRIMVKGVFRIDDFIKDNQPAEQEFENIKKLPPKRNDRKFDDRNQNNSGQSNFGQNNLGQKNYSKPNNLENSASRPNNNLNATNNKIENKIAQKIDQKITRLDIKISDEKAILPLKTVILQKISDDKNQNNNSPNDNLPNDNLLGTEIFLVAESAGRCVNIKLAHKYKIQEIDLFRLKNLHKNIEIISVIYQ